MKKLNALAAAAAALTLVFAGSGAAFADDGGDDLGQMSEGMEQAAVEEPADPPPPPPEPDPAPPAPMPTDMPTPPPADDAGDGGAAPADSDDPPAPDDPDTGDDEADDAGPSALSEAVEVPVDPAISLPGYSPADPPYAGDAVAISGVGFEAGETVNFFLDAPAAAMMMMRGGGSGIPVGSATAGPDGSFTGSFTIPGETPPGPHTVSATGESSGASDSADFEVAAAPPEPGPVTVTLPDYNPAEGAQRGSAVAISGSGYVPGETVTFTLGSGGTSVGSAVVDADGAFTGTFTVPGSEPVGIAVVTATGDTSARAGSAEFEVASDPTPEPTTGSIVDITLEGCVVTLEIATTGAADFELEVWDDGAVIASESWPTTRAGTHFVYWTITEPAGASAPGVGFALAGDGIYVDSVDPCVYPDTVADSCSGAVPVTVTLPEYDDTAGAQPGQVVPIAGSGYLPGETVVFSLSATGEVLGSAVVGEDGTFLGTFTVPAGAAPGSYTVLATGELSFRVGEVIFRILEPPALVVQPAKLELAKTGADDTSLMLLSGTGLALLGALLLGATRKRTQ